MDFIGLNAWASRSFSLSKLNKIVQVYKIVSSKYLKIKYGS